MSNVCLIAGLKSRDVKKAGEAELVERCSAAQALRVLRLLRGGAGVASRVLRASIGAAPPLSDDDPSGGRRRRTASRAEWSGRPGRPAVPAPPSESSGSASSLSVREPIGADGRRRSRHGLARRFVPSRRPPLARTTAKRRSSSERPTRSASTRRRRAATVSEMPNRRTSGGAGATGFVPICRSSPLRCEPARSSAP
jgi:hypothetical protein